MNIERLFPGRPESRPTIYAYAETRPELAGLLKVGYTDRPTARSGRLRTTAAG